MHRLVVQPDSRKVELTSLYSRGGNARGLQRRAHHALCAWTAGSCSEGLVQPDKGHTRAQAAFTAKRLKCSIHADRTEGELWRDVSL